MEVELLRAMKVERVANMYVEKQSELKTNLLRRCDDITEEYGSPNQRQEAEITEGSQL